MDGALLVAIQYFIFSLLVWAYAFSEHYVDVSIKRMIFLSCFSVEFCKHNAHIFKTTLFDDRILLLRFTNGNVKP